MLSWFVLAIGCLLQIFGFLLMGIGGELLLDGRDDRARRFYLLSLPFFVTAPIVSYLSGYIAR